MSPSHKLSIAYHFSEVNSTSHQGTPFSRWGVGKAKTFDLALPDFSSSQKSQATKLQLYIQNTSATSYTYNWLLKFWNIQIETAKPIVSNNVHILMKSVNYKSQVIQSDYIFPFFEKASR